MPDGDAQRVAVEARDIVRRAAGDVVGLTIAAQVRQAARHLSYAADDWRVREAWYGRAESWSATAVNNLRQRSAAWRERGKASVVSTLVIDEPAAHDRATLEQRLGAVRATLIELGREVDAIAIEVAATVDGARR